MQAPEIARGIAIASLIAIHAWAALGCLSASVWLDSPWRHILVASWAGLALGWLVWPFFLRKPPSSGWKYAGLIAGLPAEIFSLYFMFASLELSI